MAEQLRPHEPDLASFIDALFRYAEEGTFVSWRAFRDDTKDAPPVFIESSLVTNEISNLVEPAVRYADRAANYHGKSVFCPPVATFRDGRRAREADLANGLALSVECDTFPAAARLMLERILGPATVVVASGGLWVDNDVIHEKLHLHWRLNEPTSTQDDHARLKRARILATAIVGGDATNVPAVHPIRWPGSWHRKAEPRLARIVDLQRKAEISLSDALEQLELAASSLPSRKAARILGEDLAGDTGTTSALVTELMSGSSIHAPLVALAYRYLKGGMADGQAVLTLRGLMDAIPEHARNRPDQPDRWAGHYRDVSRTVRTAREKLLLEGNVPGIATSDVGEFVAGVGAPAIVLHRTPEPPPEIPAHLLTPPGILGDVARYGVESAVRPVPVFAVQAALALGSVVCARRYVSSNRNYSSLYFMNVAKSGTGKEEAKTTIERILKAAGAARLMAGSSYSSGNAVFSALLKKPQHITIIDEFGKYLEAASNARDSFRSDALTQLMEAFGRAHGEMYTPQFSTMTLSPTAQSSHEPRAITRPAITLLAMTTPSTFYESLRSSRIVDGFLNRFIVAEHAGPRLPMAEWHDVEIPPQIVAWVKHILTPRGNLDLGLGEQLGDPIIVELTEHSRELSRRFEAEMFKLADRLESSGLGDMPIRAREIALRLSLILALSDTPDTPMITQELFEWASDYVRYFMLQTVRALQERMADSATERTRNTILAAIRKTGGHGVTNRDLHRGKTFIGIPKRELHDAIEALITAELIAWTDVPHQGPGRPRRALVATGESGEEPNSALEMEHRSAS